MSKVDEALTVELEAVSIESTSESKRILVATTIEQLRMKLEQITKLDNSIADSIQVEDELESEICDADSYQTTLEQQITLLTQFMKNANQPPVAARPTHPPTETDDTIVPLSTDDLTDTKVTKKSIHTDSDSSPVSDATSHDTPTHTSRDTHTNYSRLPKQHLPTFDGNPLQWQTLWDSFSAAVDSNPCLTGVQKFNYLRTQLQGMHLALLQASQCLTLIILTH